MIYYFLGIGGIGMSALARFFKQGGHTVSGYDRTPSPLTKQLESEGIAVHYDDNPVMVPDMVDMVVYTPAVPRDTQVFQHVIQKGFPIMKRSQMLGELTQGRKCIAVAGSHGKTTTSAMIAHILHESPVGCSAFLGGIAKNFDSNLLVDNNSQYVVVEADEYDRSFLKLHPFYSVITATDPDHLDIYGTHEKLIEAFQQYANLTDPEGALFVKEGIAEHHHHHDHDHQNDNENDNENENQNDNENENQNDNDNDNDNPDYHTSHISHHTSSLLHLPSSIPCFTYSARSIEPDYYAINVRNYNGNIFFDLRTPQKVLFDLQLCNSCLYNVENAVAASAVALSCGLDEYQLRHGLKTFAGIRRRFDVRVKRKDFVYIDDYAHHPKEIAATIESVKYLYPDKRIVGIFQPHLYSRTRDLADQFAEALKPLDEIILMPIYPAREKPIPGVSSGMILRKIESMSKYLSTADQVPDLAEALCPDVLITMGAGDIDRLVPILEERFS